VTAGLRRRVEALCSEACAGREPGSPEGLRARELIAGELSAAGVSFIEQPVPGCRGANLIARLNPGQEKAILVGAHFDHLGREKPGHAYWSADDNAAAVALALDLAGRLATREDKLTGEVLIAFFDGEEPPHFLTSEMGSMHFVDNPVVPLERIHTAVILDLVGHDLGPDNAPAEVRKTLFAMGAEKSPPLAELVRGANAEVSGLHVRQCDIDVVPPMSDYEPFRRRSVPFLFLTCGRWRHYHEITDTPDRLAYDKLASTADFLEALVDALLDHDGPRPSYTPTLRGDADTLASLLAIGRALAPNTPPAAAAIELLEGVQERSRRAGKLGAADWHTVAQIIAFMEHALQ